LTAYYENNSVKLNSYIYCRSNGIWHMLQSFVEERRAERSWLCR